MASLVFFAGVVGDCNKPADPKRQYRECSYLMILGGKTLAVRSVSVALFVLQESSSWRVSRVG